MAGGRALQKGENRLIDTGMLCGGVYQRRGIGAEVPAPPFDIPFI